MKLYIKLRNELLKEIRKDEYEYCFDREYCPDDHWERENPEVDRETAFQEAIKYFNSLSIEDIAKIFGDKYDYVFEKYGLKAYDCIQINQLVNQ